MDKEKNNMQEEKDLNSVGSNKETEVQKEKSKNIERQHEKLLKMVLLIMGGFALMVIVMWYIYFHSFDFYYKNVHFTRVKQGQLMLYRTVYPLYSGGKKVGDFNLYLRTSPKKLENVQFNGTFEFKRNMVLNLTDSFNCQGDGIIAVANLVNFMQSLGTKVIKDENATCDPKSRYIYMAIKPGNETEITEDSEACYTMTIKGCEILEGTERFILEGLIELNNIKIPEKFNYLLLVFFTKI